MRILAAKAVMGLAIATTGRFKVAFVAFTVTCPTFATVSMQPNHLHGPITSKLRKATYKHHCHINKKLPILTQKHVQDPSSFVEGFLPLPIRNPVARCVRSFLLLKLAIQKR